MFRLRLVALLCLLPLGLALAPSPPHAPPPPPPHPAPPGLVTPDFTNVTVFSPPSNWTAKRTSYARTAVLRHDCSNTILASFTASFPGNASIPIFQSTDGGKTWSDLSRVYFKMADYNGGRIAQPFIYELPEKVGKFPAGTLLASGNGVPRGSGSTNIEVHASLDKG